MKSRNMKRIFAFVMCVMLCIPLLFGCRKQELHVIEPLALEEVDTFSFDLLGGTDVMPIGGFYGPMNKSYSARGQKLPDYYTDEFFSLLDECGITVLAYVGADYADDPDLTMKVLDLGEKYGIGIYVTDSYITNNIGENTLSLEELDERVNNYINHPACLGLQVIDEPVSDNYNSYHPEKNMKLYATLFQRLEELGVTTYGNLYRLNELGPIKYELYVQEFIDTCPTKYLEFDNYPFKTDDSKEYALNWFQNLSIIRDNAEEAGIPYWTFIQAGAQWNDEKAKFDSNGYFPSEGNFNWLINTALAYGTKGIHYFPTVQPSHFAYTKTDDLDFQRNGLIGAWGNKNRWYYYAQNANEHIAVIDEVLMNSVNKGILLSGTLMEGHFEDVKFILEGTSWRELKDISGDTMIGCFNYLGKSAFYVVNYDTEYAQEITLDFYDSYNMRVVQKAETSYVNTNSLTLQVHAGDGVLIVIEN